MKESMKNYQFDVTNSFPKIFEIYKIALSFQTLGVRFLEG